MPLPLVTDRPEKTISSIVSRWNAGDLPLIYDLTNTKWPVNSEDSTVAITSISDDNGSARLNHGSSTGLVVKEWVNVAGTTNYNGPHQITAVSGNNLTIDFPFGVSETGTSQKYFQNYTTLIRVNVGLDPTHEFVALKPNTLVGTIEQRPDTDNITLADVKEYVKNKLNTIYDESQASWPNDVNAWTDFYISFAERYDLVTAEVVGDFTSAFTDDTNVDGIIFLHAIHGALQFGDARGGNMFDNTVFDSTDAGGYFDGLAEFMTFFERLKIIDYNNFNVSIILDKNAEYPDLNIIRLEITEFDQNDNVLLITISAVPRQDYGLYRIDFNDIVFQTDTTHIEIVLLDTNSFEVSETKIIDIDVECFDPILPATPENLTATAFEPLEVADIKIDVAWDWIDSGEGGGSEFILERSTAGGAFVQLATPTLETFTFEDTAVTQNTLYNYRIKVNGNPRDSDFSNEDSDRPFGIVQFETSWDDAAANDGEFLLDQWDVNGTKDIVKWYIADVLFATTDDLLVPADDGTLDGTRKEIKLISNSLWDSNNFNPTNMRISGTLDWRGFNRCELDILSIQRASAGGLTPSFAIDAMTFPDDLVEIGEGTGNESQFSMFTNTNMTLVTIDVTKVQLGIGSAGCVAGFKLDPNGFLTTITKFADGSAVNSTDSVSQTRWACQNLNVLTEWDVSNVDLDECEEWDTGGSNLLASILFRTAASSANKGLTRARFDGCDLAFMDRMSRHIQFEDTTLVIQLENNSMTTAEVNCYLVDFATDATARSATNGTITIDGTNAAPDGASGGCDGDQAKADLIALGLTVTTN